MKKRNFIVVLILGLVGFFVPKPKFSKTGWLRMVWMRDPSTKKVIYAWGWSEGDSGSFHIVSPIFENDKDTQAWADRNGFREVYHECLRQLA